MNDAMRKMSKLLCFQHLSESRFLLDALHRRNKFANFCHDLMQIFDCVGVYNTSTLEGHFVSSPREREKRDRRESRDEREGQGRKRNRNESEETEEL